MLSFAIAVKVSRVGAAETVDARRTSRRSRCVRAALLLPVRAATPILYT